MSTQSINQNFVINLTRFDNSYRIQSEIENIGTIDFQAVPLELSTSEISSAGTPFAHYFQELGTRPSLLCSDVQPLNGSCKKNEGRFLKDLIRKEHVEDLQTCLQSLSGSEGVRVFVLDLKDTENSYRNRDQIARNEVNVSTFLMAVEPKEVSPRKTFHQLIHTNQVDFFLREGLLKTDILAQLSPEFSGYFTEDPEGGQKLCQLCEIIMNLFKQGYQVSGLGSEFHPQHYFLQTRRWEVLSELECSAVDHTHNVALETVYPRHYENLYSERELYFQAISQVWDATHSCDSNTHVTRISIQEASHE